MNAYQALIERIARTRVGARIMIPLATAIDRRLFRWSNGRVSTGVGTSFKDNVCLVSMRGAKSGKVRAVPLLGTRVADSIVVIASNGGATRHPAWYFNLKKNPECEVVMRGARSRRVAREVSGVERERLWAAAVAVYPGYSGYAERAEREIPVITLERAP